MKDMLVAAKENQKLIYKVLKSMGNWKDEQTLQIKSKERMVINNGGRGMDRWKQSIEELYQLATKMLIYKRKQIDNIETHSGKDPKKI